MVVMELKARLYQPGDETQLVELLGIIFEGWPERDLTCSKEEYWRWKYRDNPIGVNFNSVGLDGDKIIGCNHGFFLYAKVGDKILMGHQASDLGTHPDYRRMGLTHKMSEIKIELHEKYRTAFTYTVAENPIVTKVIRKGRPVFPQPIIELVKIDDISYHLEMLGGSGSWFKIPTVQLLKLGKKLKSDVMRKPDVTSDNIMIKKCKKFDDHLDALYERVKHRYNFILERKQDYLNWRYMDPRGGDYHILTAEDDSGLQGYIVLRINRFRKDYPVGWVVDLFTDPTRSDVACSLLNEAKHHFEKDSVNVVRYWCVKNHPYDSIFQENGFLDIRKKAPELVIHPRTIGPEFNVYLNSPPEKLHFQAGDSECI